MNVRNRDLETNIITLKARIKNHAKYLVVLLSFGFCVFPATGLGAMEKQEESKNVSSSSKGYSINHKITKRIWKIVTAEGFFPKKTINFHVTITGTGKDWSYRGQEGFYYSFSEIHGAKKYGDIGYMWVDAKREWIYVNFYWVLSPDELQASDVNGKYKIP